MFWGVKTMEGRLYLVADDYAADVVLEEWERGEGQLVLRDGVYDEWQPARPPEIRRLRRAAKLARSARQAIVGEMEP